MPVSQRRIILDVDPGIDDALAILLALRSPELRVEAITTVAGNVVVELGTQNALKLVQLAGRDEVVVARGADGPLARKLRTADFVHGRDGLGGADLPSPTMAVDPRPAAEVIVETVRAHPGEVTLVGVSPLTNLATAFRADAELGSLVQEVIVMGGAWSGGNATPAAEFNIYCDPEAAQVVLDSGVPLTVLTLEATRQTLITRADLPRLRECGPAVGRMAEHYVSFGESAGRSGAALHDPLAVGVAIDPAFVIEAIPVRMDVELEGRLTRGQTVVNRSLQVRRTVDEGDHIRVAEPERVEPNVTMAMKIDAERFVRFFLDRLQKGDGARFSFAG